LGLTCARDASLAVDYPLSRPSVVPHRRRRAARSDNRSSVANDGPIVPWPI